MGVSIDRGDMISPDDQKRIAEFMGWTFQGTWPHGTWFAVINGQECSTTRLEIWLDDRNVLAEIVGRLDRKQYRPYIRYLYRSVADVEYFSNQSQITDEVVFKAHNAGPDQICAALIQIIGADHAQHS